MKKKYFNYTTWCFLFLVYTNLTQGQLLDTFNVAIDKNVHTTKTEVLPLMPKTLSEHPVALFTMRMPAMLNRYISKHKRLQFHTTAANIWLPELHVYRPINPSEELTTILQPMHYSSRAKYLLDNAIPMESFFLNVDGVVRSFRLDYYHSLPKYHEVGLTFRAYWLTGGNEFFHYPVSDSFIESFHDAFTEPDQFSRKIFPFHQARMAYIDGDGNAFSFKKGAVWSSGMELYYAYHLPIKNTTSRVFYANVNSRFYLPFTNIHPYSSIGIAGNGVAHFLFREKHALDLSLSPAFVFQQLWKWQEGVTFDTRKVQMSLLFYVGYAKHFSKNRLWSIGLQNQTQNSWYNNHDYKPNNRFGTLGMHGHFVSSEDAIRWWNQSALALYTFTQSWSLILGYRDNNWGISIYLLEDLWVNNAPDLQTGISVEWNW